MSTSKTQPQPIRVLFLCTHNSARSILAEALLNALGEGRFLAYSAGSRPRPKQLPHPLGLQALREQRIPTMDLRSKSWDEFAGPKALPMDLVITVCDNAKGESCPLWPGHPAVAHWDYADPSAGNGSDAEKLEAFRHTLQLIKQRLLRLIALPPSKLSKDALAQTARELSHD